MVDLSSDILGEIDDGIGGDFFSWGKRLILIICSGLLALPLISFGGGFSGHGLLQGGNRLRRCRRVYHGKL
ncbi:MAG TPA: hypothetical protein DDX99_09435 [Desulfofustis sp.]|nr:hypothetical protein [Desulfofustis sp.]HBH31024.1 hypothetical protein [Desulfofustis sp.]